MTSTLEGRRVLVTGGSSGIGYSVAAQAVAQGARVALLARSAERLREVAHQLGAEAVPADVSDPAQAADAVSRAADVLGGLDAVVNNAGIARPSTITDGDPADWRLMFEVNVLGLLHVTAAAIPWLRSADRGDIVNVSSMSGRRVPSPEMGVYSGTKFAVHAISEGLRKELSADAIRVIVVSPGFVRTEIFADVAGTDVGDRYAEKMRNTGLAPEAVAAQIVGALAAPADVELTEIAINSVRQ